MMVDLRYRAMFHFMRVLEIVHDMLELIFTAPDLAAAMADITFFVDK